MMPISVFGMRSSAQAQSAVRLCLQDRSEYFYHALSGQYSSQAKQQLRLDTEELENCLSSSVSVEDSLEEKELIAIIEDFLRDLSQENRVIFLRRYWFSDSYAEIAARTGLTEKNVSVRLS